MTLGVTKFSQNLTSNAFFFPFQDKTFFLKVMALAVLELTQ